MYAHTYTHTYMHTLHTCVYVIYFIYILHEREIKLHTCGNMCFMFVTRLLLPCSGTHTEKKQPSFLFIKCVPFYPCSMTMVALWLKEECKECLAGHELSQYKQHCLGPGAFGDAFSMWRMFVGAGDESLSRCGFSLAGGEGPTDWSIPAFGPCGRGSLQSQDPS